MSRKNNGKQGKNKGEFLNTSKWIFQHIEKRFRKDGELDLAALDEWLAGHLRKHGKPYSTGTRYDDLLFKHYGIKCKPRPRENRWIKTRNKWDSDEAACSECLRRFDMGQMILYCPATRKSKCLDCNKPNRWWKKELDDMDEGFRRAMASI